MAHTYSGTDYYPIGATLPDDGDASSAASVNVPLEALADRTTYLKNRLGLYFPNEIDNTQSIQTIGSSLGSSTSASFGTGDVALGSVNCKNGDLVKVSVNFMCYNTVNNTGAYRLAFQPASSGVKIPVPESHIYWTTMPTSIEPCHVEAMVLVSGATGTELVSFYLQMSTALASTVRVYSPMAVSLVSYRSVL